MRPDEGTPPGGPDARPEIPSPPDPAARVAADLLARTAPALIAHVNCDETLTDVSGTFVESLGVDLHAWVGRALGDVVSNAAVLRLVRRGLQGEAGNDVIGLAGRPWLVAVAPVPVPAQSLAQARGLPTLTGVAVVLTYADVIEVQQELTSQTSRTDQLTAIAELSTDFISLATVDGVVTYLNRAGCELVGLDSPEAAVGVRVEEFLDDEHRARLPATRRQIQLTGSFQGDNGLRHFGTGQSIPMSMDSFLVTRRSDGRPIAVATVQRDLRSRIAAELALVVRVQEQRALAELGTAALTMSLEELIDEAVRLLGARYDDVTVGVLRHRPEGDLMDVIASSRPEWTRVTVPVIRATLTGTSLLDGRIASSDDIHHDDRLDAERAAEFEAGAALSCPVPGDVRPWGVVAFSTPRPRQWTEDDRTFVSSVAATLGAAVRRHELEVTLVHQALHDPLTGLPNRTVMQRRITEALTRAEGTDAMVGVLMLDLDDFRSVNDTLGHVRGDDLLTELAGRLATVVGDGETVARFGGGQFVVLLEDVADPGRAEAVAGDLLEACAAGVQLEGLQLALSASIGVALRRSGDATAHSLLSEADIAMYRAKRDRPGSTRFFDEVMREETLDRLDIAGELRGAVAGGRITVDYQPIVGLPSGELIAMEALARCTDGSGLAVSPELFIPVAEQIGLIGELGEHVLRSACAEASRWQDHGPVGVRVNASAHQLRDPHYADRVARALSDAGLPAALLGIEITESAFVEEDAETQRTLTRLRRSGVSLLIDDFGTGYSSLSYLARFPVVDIVKIDRSFLSQGVRGEAVVTAVIGLGRAFGLQVCAEGVETSAQLAAVTELGCDYAQGHLLGRPVAAEETRAVIAGWSPERTSAPR